MREHLSAKRIAQTVAAGPTPVEAVHLQDCPVCRAEAAHLESALRNFREGVMAGLTDSPVRFNAAVTKTVHSRWPVYAAAAAVVLFAAPVLHSVHSRQRAAQAMADAQLLEQVNQDITQAVPGSMQPLEQLVVWDSVQQDSSRKEDVR